jgi:hypothetical protein
MERSYTYPIATSADSIEYVLGVSAGFVMQFDANPVGMLHVHRNNVDQNAGLSGADSNKVQFTTEVVDANGWFDNATNYRYTPLVAGRYMVILSVAGVYASGSDSVQANISKSGTEVLSGTYIDAPSTTSVSSVSGIVSMNGSTDYIEGFVYLPASPTAILGSPLDTHMMIYRVSD